MIHLQPSFKFLADVLRCCFNISTSFSSLIMPSILSAPVHLAAKQTHNSVLHGQDGVLWLASQTLFPPNISLGPTAQFMFHQTRGQFFKDVCTRVAAANCSRAYLWWFWSSGFSLAELPHMLCRHKVVYRYFYSCFVQQLSFWI